MSLVFKASAPELTATRKAVLLALADHADKNGGRVFPGAERLALFTALSERAVRKALSELRSLAYIVEVRAACQHRPTEYRIDLARLRAMQARAAPVTAPADNPDLHHVHPWDKSDLHHVHPYESSDLHDVHPPLAPRAPLNGSRGAPRAPEPSVKSLSTSETPKERVARAPAPPHDDPLFKAIAQVCAIDLTIKGAGDIVNKAAAVLKAAQPPYTAQDVLKWGQQQAWRKTAPSIKQLQQEIGSVRWQKPTEQPSPSASKIRYYDGSEPKRREYTPEEIANLRDVLRAAKNGTAQPSAAPAATRIAQQLSRQPTPGEPVSVDTPPGG